MCFSLHAARGALSILALVIAAQIQHNVSGDQKLPAIVHSQPDY